MVLARCTLDRTAVWPCQLFNFLSQCTGCSSVRSLRICLSLSPCLSLPVSLSVSLSLPCFARPSLSAVSQIFLVFMEKNAMLHDTHLEPFSELGLFLVLVWRFAFCESEWGRKKASKCCWGLPGLQSTAPAFQQA